MPIDLTDDKSTLVQVMACAVRQQAIAWVNVDPYICRHMVLLGRNELKLVRGPISILDARKSRRTNCYDIGNTVVFRA